MTHRASASAAHSAYSPTVHGPSRAGDDRTRKVRSSPNRSMQLSLASVSPHCLRRAIPLIAEPKFEIASVTAGAVHHQLHGLLDLQRDLRIGRESGAELGKSNHTCKQRIQRHLAYTGMAATSLRGAILPIKTSKLARFCALLASLNHLERLVRMSALGADRIGPATGHGDVTSRLAELGRRLGKTHHRLPLRPRRGAGGIPEARQPGAVEIDGQLALGKQGVADHIAHERSSRRCPWSVPAGPSDCRPSAGSSTRRMPLLVVTHLPVL